MQKLEHQLQQMLNNQKYSDQDFKLLNKVINSIPKDSQASENLVNCVYNFIDTMFCIPELLIKALQSIALLTHFEHLVNSLLQVESKIRFLTYQFPFEIADQDRLIIVIVGLIDPKMPKDLAFAATLVLEGFSFYALGKKKAILYGAIEQLDSLITSEESHFESVFDINHVALLECLSNLISSKSTRQLCKQVNNQEVQLLQTLTCHASLFKALLKTRNTKQARAVCSCLFNLLLDNFNQYVQLNLINELTVQKLIEISCSYEDSFGGRAASLCLLLIFGGFQLKFVTKSKPNQNNNQLLNNNNQNNNRPKPDENDPFLIQDIEEQMDEKEAEPGVEPETDDFSQFRKQMKLFKKFQKQLKQLQLYAELLHELNANENIQNNDEDFTQFFIEKYTNEAEKLHFESQKYLQEEQKMAKTTGAMRQGVMRAKTKSAIDDW
ncbi:Conserved_hypothetical protein [Hexamita inflata]|uniref:Uncharacterized protein n=1 Tax=Hexamita inflata TaxID=28002 RepID=A0AA86QRG9_9EUKA|nr:Conserved hypothetical protein [Hexamita inflata]